MNRENRKTRKLAQLGWMRWTEKGMICILGCYSGRGSILVWMVIFFVYGADTISIDLSLSALIS
jgi:hypothetical protein